MLTLTWYILQSQDLHGRVIPVDQLPNENKNEFLYYKNLKPHEFWLVDETYRYSDPAYVPEVSSELVCVLSFVYVVNLLIQDPETQKERKISIPHGLEPQVL